MARAAVFLAQGRCHSLWEFTALPMGVRRSTSGAHRPPAGVHLHLLGPTPPECWAWSHWTPRRAPLDSHSCSSRGLESSLRLAPPVGALLCAASPMQGGLGTV